MAVGGGGNGIDGAFEAAAELEEDAAPVVEEPAAAEDDAASVRHGGVTGLAFASIFFDVEGAFDVAAIGTNGVSNGPTAGALFNGTAAGALVAFDGTTFDGIASVFAFFEGIAGGISGGASSGGV